MWLSAMIVIIFVELAVCYDDKKDTLPLLYPDDAEKYMHFTTKCFKKYGCFYTGPPWYHPLYRPVSVPPADKLHLKYLLFTRSNRNDPYLLKPTIKSLKKSPYENNSTTKVLVHGYGENTTVYTSGIVEELLNYKSYNLIVLDWSRDNHPPLYQAVANARLIGAHVAELLKFIMANTGLKAEDIHVIGHSLGGQLISYIGKRIKNLGRLTGLDPAGPYFMKRPKEVRLDKSDARFVDIIQTNAGDNAYTGIGEDRVVGHAVFTVNGGNHQPGCDHKPAIKIDKEFQSNMMINQCSHLRCLDLLQYSIRTCKYDSTACFSYQGFKNGLCKDTPFHNRMGLHAVKPPFQLNYFLDTDSKPPYCELKSH